AQGLAIVARSNLAEAKAWRDAAPARAGLFLSDDPVDALAHLAQDAAGPVSAIVASRPRDHGRDVEFCLQHSLPALVEKPFAPDPDEAGRLTARARAQGLKLGLGVEFSLLPELHFLA